MLDNLVYLNFRYAVNVLYKAGDTFVWVCTSEQQRRYLNLGFKTGRITWGWDSEFYKKSRRASSRYRRERKAETKSEAAARNERHGLCRLVVMSCASSLK